MSRFVFQSRLLHVLGVIAVVFAFAMPVDAQVSQGVTVSVTVSTSDGAPVSGATATLSGGGRKFSHLTDSHGLVIFPDVPIGIYDLVVQSATLGTTQSTGIEVVRDVNVSAQYEAAPLLREIGRVTTRRVRINVTPASVVAKTPDDYKLEGKTQLRQILQEIPSVSIGGPTSSANSSIPDSPLAPQVISIRGALPYETATLLDNMPLYGSSFGATLSGSGTDLASYNPNAFSVYEIVKGPGAASPSIIDSIGGTLLLRAPGGVLKNAFDFTTSTDAYGGTASNVQQALRLGKLSAQFGVGVLDSPGPVTVPDQMGFTDNNSIYKVNGQNFYCPPVTCVAARSYPPGYSTNGSLTATSSGFTACCIPDNSHWTQNNGFASLRYEFVPGISAQIFYTGLHSREQLAYYYIPSTFTPPAGYAGSLPPGTSNVLYANANPQVLTQGSSTLEEKIEGTIGRGSFRVAALQNRTFADERFFVFPTLQMQLFGGAAIGTSASNTPIIFNGQTATVQFKPFLFHFQTPITNRDLMASYATDLSGYFHAGVSYVQSYYNYPQSFDGVFNTVDVTTGNLVPHMFAGAPTSSYQRTNEVRLAIGGNPSATTNVELSWYFARLNYHVLDPNDKTRSNYIDSPFTYSAPRLGFVWRQTPETAFRASVGGGFSAAALNSLIGTNGAVTPTTGGYSQRITNVNLQPEKSFNFDVGFDQRLGNDTALAFDLYRSNLFGQIYRQTSIEGTFNGQPLYVSRTGNLGLSRYEGLELSLRRDVPRGIVWNFAGDLMRGYLVSVPPGFYNTVTCTNCTNLTVVPNINFNGAFSDVAVPYSQASALVGYRWARDRFLTVDAQYFGPNNSYFRPAFTVLNSNVSLPLSRNVAIQGSFRNITGVYSGALENLGEFTGNPAISGGPTVTPSTNYGPRTFLVTLRVHS